MIATRVGGGIIASVLFFSWVSLVLAQGNEDLRATIRAAILSDPRSSSLSQVQIDVMIDLLAEGAQENGMSAQDIMWRPDVGVQQQQMSVPSSCDSRSILCKINTAFGFEGDDMTIPIWLGITSALLLLLIGGMIEMHRRHARAAAHLQNPLQ